MTINANNVPRIGGKSKPADAMEAGNYPCRIAQVIDLGLQPQRAWEGQDKPPAQTIMVTYEFVDEFLKDDDGNDLTDKPRWLSEEFPLHSLSSELAKSTKRMVALDPNGLLDGDWGKLVGIPCTVTIIAKQGKGKNADRVFNNVAGVSIMRSRDAVSCVELVNPPKTLDLDTPDMEIFKSLPDWLQDKIKANLEYKGSALDNLLTGNTPAPQAAPTVKDTPIEEVKGDDIPW